MFWPLVIGIAVALLVAWGVLVLSLVLARPKGALVQEAMRLLKETKNLPATTEPPFPTWGKRVKPPTE